ncbi:hypothetical protein PUN28_006539 [Cardiocondyla obscurior]|uniref:Uncharacterized protein n=1 Tax=Cardiocondyla obscurior TaxID=286306 RepID=A0AAW2GEC7_9HYME
MPRARQQRWRQQQQQQAAPMAATTVVAAATAAVLAHRHQTNRYPVKSPASYQPPRLVCLLTFIKLHLPARCAKRCTMDGLVSGRDSLLGVTNTAFAHAHGWSTTARLLRRHRLFLLSPDNDTGSRPSSKTQQKTATGDDDSAWEREQQETPKPLRGRRVAPPNVYAFHDAL